MFLTRPKIHEAKLTEWRKEKYLKHNSTSGFQFCKNITKVLCELLEFEKSHHTTLQPYFFKFQIHCPLLYTDFLGNKYLSLIS